MESVRNSKAGNKPMTRDEVIALVTNLVDRSIKRYNQSEKERIMQMLTELDKDRTRNMLDLEKMRLEFYKQIQEAQESVNSDAETHRKDCQADMNKKIEGSAPNYWAIISLIVTFLLPFMGWVYSVQQSVWDMKVELTADVATLKSTQVNDDRPAPSRSAVPVANPVSTNTASGSQ